MMTANVVPAAMMAPHMMPLYMVFLVMFFLLGHYRFRLRVFRGFRLNPPVA